MFDHTFAVCAYKESPYLEECVKSLMKQTIKSNIIIVTSTPNSYIKEIAELYHLPYFINEGKSGIAQDWNFGYQCAKEKYQSKYITIAHQDDIYFPEYAEKVLQHMDMAKDPIICFTNYVEIRNDKKVISNRLLKVKRLMLTPLKIHWMEDKIWIRRMILSLGDPICCPSVTFSKVKIPEGPFSPGFRSDEDWEAWEKLSRLRGEFIYEKDALVGHRIHENSETTNILNDHARAKEDYAMYRKFWPDFIAKRLAKAYSTSEESNDL